MRVLLINPPLQRLSEVRNAYFPLGLGYLAAVLDAHGSYVRIYNADKGPEEKDFYPISSNWERIRRHQRYVEGLRNDSHPVWAEIRETISKFEPDVVGLTIMTTTLPSAFKVASICKEYSRNSIIIAGGIHPTVEPERVLRNKDIDFLVAGEGEQTLLELLEAIRSEGRALNRIHGLAYRQNGSFNWNGARALYPNIDKIPFPARHLVLRPELYTPSEMAHLVTSRGCPYRCTFCEAHKLWTRRARFRTPENVISEIRSVIDEYHSHDFRFNDDSFTVNRKRVMEICRRIIEEKLDIGWTCLSRVDLVDDELLAMMKEAGCQSISFGIESGSERILKLIKKDTNRDMIFQAVRQVRKNKIKFSTCFMIGLPFETREDIDQSLQMMKRIRPDLVNVCTFTPYPGSEIYEECQKQGLIPEDIDWGMYSHHSPYNRFFRNMPEQEFQWLLDTMVKTSDLCNARLNVPYLLEHLRRRWRYYVRNPLLLISRIFALLWQTSRLRLRLIKSGSVRDGKNS